MTNPANAVHVIGGGLAGSEASWQLAEMGVPVHLHEMRPMRKTAAHSTDGLAELVCSNSFRSDDASSNAVGVLHAEMRLLNSVVMRAAEVAKVPAGGALAVDRDLFSGEVERLLTEHPNVTLCREEVMGLPPQDWGNCIVATGPLTSDALVGEILKVTGQDQLAFFDAIAPIIHTDSIDMSIAWYQSRYDKPGPGGTGKDYINLPMDEAQYKAFIAAMIAAPMTEFHDWEKDTPYFEGCLPIEVMAERGIDTPRFGPLKPVGLTDPRTGEQPHAVVQLRQDNKLGTLYNMVGFQTKMKHGGQVEVFRMIPGLENAEFARLGGIHRNTFLNAPTLLDEQLRLKNAPHLRFAGQMTGVEGYVESAAMGLMAARFVAADYRGEAFTPPPQTTAHGALLQHLTTPENAENFQPMNVNFGLMPPPERVMMETRRGPKLRKLRGRDRKTAIAARAAQDFETWMTSDEEEDTAQAKVA